MKKKIISLAAVAVMLISCLPFGASAATPFTDVEAGQWYVKAVEHVYTNKLFNGTSATTFSPSGVMTRGMFVQVLANFTTGYDKTSYVAQPFMDTDVKEWYAAPVQWAAENEIVGGVGKGNFNPAGAVTREQMATLLYRYAQKTGNTVETGDTEYNAFPDKDDTSSYAVEALKWATHNSIINGSSGKLNPKGRATRAQVAQIFLNAKDVLTKKEVLLPDYSTMTAEDLTFEQFQTMFCRVTKIELVKNGTTVNGVYTPDTAKPDYYKISAWTSASHNVGRIYAILKDCEEATVTDYLKKYFEYFYKDEFGYKNADDFGMSIELSVWNSIDVYTINNLGDSTKDPAIPFGELQVVVGELGAETETDTEDTDTAVEE